MHQLAITHHTVTPQFQPINEAISSINRTHEARGFNLSELNYHVGYHYLIGANGEVVQTRVDTEHGNHTKEEDMNFKALGIALLGDFRTDTPTPEQRKALTQLLREKAIMYNWTKEDIKYHGQFKQTECCGENLIKELPNIINQVFMDKMPEWFKTEGYYDRAKEAGIQGVDEEQDLHYYQMVATIFKVVDAELKKND